MPTSTTRITLPSPAPGTERALLVHRFGQPLPADVALPLACFAVTVELRGQTDVSDAYAAADSAALVYRKPGNLLGD